MRISDWSSDVCSSDLPGGVAAGGCRGFGLGDGGEMAAPLAPQPGGQRRLGYRQMALAMARIERGELLDTADAGHRANGRAAGRERGCQYVYNPGGAGSLNNNQPQQLQ